MRKKQFLLFLISLSALLIPFSFAAIDAEDVPFDAGVTFAGSPFESLAQLLSPVIVKLSVLVGGIFGLYILLILLRVYYERKNMRLLQHIRYDLDQQNRHYGIPSSRDKIGFLHKLVVDKALPSHLKKHYRPFAQKGEKKK
ncbi:MAG: hypothetical protein Q7K45_02555 [Nanoarchaeota archaeon]|nr:hypothetical protein [Nanoarchaeota archaeon]